MRLIRMSADSRLTEFPGPPSYDNSLTPNKRCSSDRPPTPLPKIPKNSTSTGIFENDPRGKRLFSPPPPKKKMDVRNRNEIQIEPRSFAIKPVRNEAER